MKAIYDNRPDIISEVGNGSVLYHYNIKEVESSIIEGQTTTQYECEEVVVWKPISSNKITEAVITSKWDSNYEQKLINEYNSAQLGLLSGDEAKARIKAYTDYLTERTKLKAQVDNDCQQLEIK